MMLNGEDIAEESVSQAVAEFVARPTSVYEPQEPLAVQTPLPMSISGTAEHFADGAAWNMPALHLHRHEYHEGTVDAEARVVVERLAAQHGELFDFLHQEIKDLQKNMVHKQFAEEVVTWGDAAQREIIRQGREIESLRTEFRLVVAELRAKLGKLRSDLDG